MALTFASSFGASGKCPCPVTGGETMAPSTGRLANVEMDVTIQFPEPRTRLKPSVTTRKKANAPSLTDRHRYHGNRIGSGKRIGIGLP